MADTTQDQTPAEEEDEPPEIADENTGGIGQKLQGLYVRPNGDTIRLLDFEPIEIIDEFEFPTEAYSMQEPALYLYFHVLLDFSGEVIDYELRSPSQYDEINIRAERTVASMTFDPVEVSNLVSTLNLPESSDGRGYWFVYKYLVEKPEFLR
jgi:hypothetical protein